MTNLFEPDYLNLEYFFALIYQLMVRLFSGLETAGLPPQFIFWLRIVLSLLGLIAAILITILVIKLNRLRQEERQEILAITDKDLAATGANEDWQRVTTHLESENESEWKLAILEADKILDQMVKKMNYPGEDLGERLRAAEVSDFTTLEEAWEAHRVRNRLAHESGFILTRREARRVVALYEKVFREFDYL